MNTDLFINSFSNQFIHDTAFLALNLSPPQNIPLSHIQLALKPIIGSRKKSNGKKARRGKGKGDDEEGDGTSIGWEIVLKKGDREAIEFATWSSI